MRWIKSPKSYPYIIVASASIIMFLILLAGDFSSRTFPVLLFISAKLSIVFAAVELCLSYLGKYEGKEEVYKSVSRAITAFGMAMCFALLIAAFESAA